MAMSHFSGGRSFTRFPAITMSPSVARSRPAIMRSVVVLPHPEGPSRQTTSPAFTDRSASLTAVNSPYFLVIFLISIVDMSALYRPKGDATQQMILEEERNEENWDQEQCFNGRQQAPQHADAPAGNRLVHGHRNGACVNAGEQQGEKKLIPGEDEAEHERCGKTRHHLWQGDLEKHAHVR